VAVADRPLAERVPVLEIWGPLTVKETEDLVFLAARGHNQFEVSHRSWLEEDRSYFVRWREDAPGAPLQVIGLVHVYQLPEMACKVSVVAFGDEPVPALSEYADLLGEELGAEGFFA
jgi:hypothetical protein